VPRRLGHGAAGALAGTRVSISPGAVRWTRANGPGEVGAGPRNAG
jgi:hypothetical protein